MPATPISARLSRSFPCAEQLESRLLLTVGDPDCEPVVTQAGSVVTVVGQTSDDVVELELGQAVHRLEFSGFEYTFDASAVTEINLGGGFGNNSIRIVGSDLDDRGTAIGLNGTLTSANYVVRSFSFQETTIAGGGGNDYGQIFGSNGDDQLQGLPESSVLTTPTNVLVAEDFERVDAYGRGGNDYGSVYGTTGRDVLVATSDYVSMTGPGITKVTRGFERVDSFGRGGDDFARIFDSPGNDSLVSTPNFTYLRTATRLSYANGFEEVEALSTLGGNDRATIFDGATTDETLEMGVDLVTISNDNYSTSISNFDEHIASSTGGNDEVIWQGLTAVDTLTVTTPDSLAVEGPNRDDVATGFATISTPALETEVEFNLMLARLQPYFPRVVVDALAARFDETRNPVNGTAQADDDLVGTPNDDAINAGASNDVVFALPGDDLIELGIGNDRVEADLGDDIAFGGGGNDEVKGGDGDDILLGGDGNDIVDGEGGTDYVSGGGGNDVFRFISLDETIVITDYDVDRDRIELINIDPADITLTTESGSMAINHPDGMQIILLGVSPNLNLADLSVAFVTGATQTTFDPDA